jgi:hypothetical protein
MLVMCTPSEAGIGVRLNLAGKMYEVQAPSTNHHQLLLEKSDKSLTSTAGSIMR